MENVMSLLNTFIASIEEYNKIGVVVRPISTLSQLDGFVNGDYRRPKLKEIYHIPCSVPEDRKETHYLDGFEINRLSPYGTKTKAIRENAPVYRYWHRPFDAVIQIIDFGDWYGLSMVRSTFKNLDGPNEILLQPNGITNFHPIYIK